MKPTIKEEPLISQREICIKYDESEDVVRHALKIYGVKKVGNKGAITHPANAYREIDAADALIKLYKSRGDGCMAKAKKWYSLAQKVQEIYEDEDGYQTEDMPDHQAGT